MYTINVNFMFKFRKESNIDKCFCLFYYTPTPEQGIRSITVIINQVSRSHHGLSKYKDTTI
jgi:hypothetical protein